MNISRRYQQLRLEMKRTSYILKHSITRRLLVVVFSIYLMVTITVTAFHMDFEYRLSKHQTIVALKNIQAMTQDSISQAIWEFNTEQLETLLNGLFSNPYIVGVALDIPQNEAIQGMTSRQIGLIEDMSGNLIYVDPKSKGAQPVQSTFERLIPDHFALTYKDALGRKITVATMTIYSSNKIVFEMVKQSYILIILNAFIKTITLWIFILWAGYYFISKPLLQLTEAIKQLATGNWKSELIYKTRSENKKTEINTLFDSFNDMTRALLQTQGKLEFSQRRLNIIFDTMPSALVAVTNTRAIAGWNKYMIQMTGIDQSGALEKNLLDVFPAFGEFDYLIDDALTNKMIKEVQHVKIENIPDKLFHISVYPITGIVPPEAVVRIDDVTEQVKQESGLAQVEKLASVGASIAGVAHEINNPLSSIMQSAQNIIRRLDPNLASNQSAAKDLNLDLNQQYKYLESREILSFLHIIQTAGERASSIVKNMLKFTRRSKAQMAKHNLVDIINDALQLCANDIAILEHTDFKDVQIEKHFSSQNVEVECFPLEIQQVLLNLIRNAVQAMQPEQPMKVTITLNELTNNKVELKLSDNGQGIPAEIIDQIFQPFFTTKPAGEGTGLGLSVCRNIIVQKHHGDMSVESRPGQGTTFTIILPKIQTE